NRYRGPINPTATQYRTIVRRLTTMRGERMSRRLGLVIGINQYQDPTFQPLAYAENNARALAGWLANEKGGRWSPSDIQLVQGDQVTRESAETLISQLFLQKAEPGDLV